MIVAARVPPRCHFFFLGWFPSGTRSQDCSENTLLGAVTGKSQCTRRKTRLAFSLGLFERQIWKGISVVPKMPHLNTFWTKYCYILPLDSSLIFKLQHFNRKRAIPWYFFSHDRWISNQERVRVSSPELNQSSEVEECNDVEFLPCKPLFFFSPQSVPAFCCLDSNYTRSRKLFLYLPL